MVQHNLIITSWILAYCTCQRKTVQPTAQRQKIQSYPFTASLLTGNGEPQPECPLYSRFIPQCVAGVQVPFYISLVTAFEVVGEGGDAWWTYTAPRAAWVVEVYGCYRR